MTDKKNIIYLVETEFQLMVSVNLALSIFKTNEYQNLIYCLKSEKRLNEFLNFSALKQIDFFLIDSKNYVDSIKLISKKKCFTFFFFQENSILNKYLAYQLKVNGAKIALGPDGTKPYGIFKKSHESLSVIKDTIADYKFLFREKLFLPAIIPSSYYKYGKTKIIDQVWLYNIEMFDAETNKTRASLKKIPSFSQEVWNNLINLFQFTTDKLSNSDEILFYLNQPLWSQEMIEAEINFLKHLVTVFPKNDLIIKLHPHTAEATIKSYKNIKNVKLVISKIPAELFIATLSNSIVFSGWSAGLSIENPSCNFYYNLNIFRKLNDKILNQIHIDSFPHIKLIDNPSQMKFK
ncbi:MAG: hypothetical protein H7250_12135 [Flavobacterium sp.]|nr:hypothetical protein [Flavobacterium sp.]